MRMCICLYVLICGWTLAEKVLQDTSAQFSVCPPWLAAWAMWGSWLTAGLHTVQHTGHTQCGSQVCGPSHYPSLWRNQPAISTNYVIKMQTYKTRVKTACKISETVQLLEALPIFRCGGFTYKVLCPWTPLGTSIPKSLTLSSEDLECSPLCSSSLADSK